MKELTMPDLTEKRALVTGATIGIGKATALGLAAAGATVAVSGRDRERGQAVVDAIEASGGSAVFVAGDLMGADTRDLAARATQVLGGAADILINSAGALAFGPTESHDDEATFDDIYALNVKAPWFQVAAPAPSVAERGGGSIVNVSTMVASFGMDGMALYGSTVKL